MVYDSKTYEHPCLGADSNPAPVDLATRALITRSQIGHPRLEYSGTPKAFCSPIEIPFKKTCIMLPGEEDKPVVYSKPGLPTNQRGIHAFQTMSNARVEIQTSFLLSIS